MKTLSSSLSLFASSATLVCCALPALFVSLGLGAVFVGLISAVPQLIWLSEHKPLVFGLGGFLLALAAGAQWKARGEACPTDPQLRETCGRARRTSQMIFWLSIILYLTGAFFAFVMG